MSVHILGQHDTTWQSEPRMNQTDEDSLLSKLPVVHKKSINKVMNSNNNSSINSSSVGSGSNKSADNRLVTNTNMIAQVCQRSDCRGHKFDGMVYSTRHDWIGKTLEIGDRSGMGAITRCVRIFQVGMWVASADAALGWTDNASRFHQSRAHFQCLPAACRGKNYADRSEMPTSHAVDSGFEWSELDCWYYRYWVGRKIRTSGTTDCELQSIKDNLKTWQEENRERAE
ncbi:hypothetical protein CLF_100900, partial [Clonorchis sinensis]